MLPSCSSELLGYISAIQPQQGLLQKWLEGQTQGEVSRSPGQEQNTALAQPDLCEESVSRAGRGCLPPPRRKATFILLGSLQWDLRPLCLGRMRGGVPNGSSEGPPSPCSRPLLHLHWQSQRAQWSLRDSQTQSGGCLWGGSPPLSFSLRIYLCLFHVC